MDQYPLDHDFNEVIRRIYDEHQNRNILCRALGPDPVLFAWAVIQAWDNYGIPDFDSEEFNDYDVHND